MARSRESALGAKPLSGYLSAKYALNTPMVYLLRIGNPAPARTTRYIRPLIPLQFTPLFFNCIGYRVTVM